MKYVGWNNGARTWKPYALYLIVFGAIFTIACVVSYVEESDPAKAHKPFVAAISCGAITLFGVLAYVWLDKHPKANDPRLRGDQ